MTFRARIAVAAAAAVALAIVTASVVVFFVVRSQLRAPIDEALEVRAHRIGDIPPGEFKTPLGETYLQLAPFLNEGGWVVQLVKADGTSVRPGFYEVGLPVTNPALAVARGEAGAYFDDMDVQGTHLRVLTFPYEYGSGYAVQVARPLTEVDESLRRIGLYLLFIAGTGVAGAAALGFVVSRAALAPVKRLTDTAETVTATGDLTQRIEIEGNDELTRLATSFNSMLAALEESTRAQRQLVADASHELRTPLTSLRTNIEVLASDRALPAEERSRLLSDVVEQLGEMTTLISELIALAHAEQHTTEPENVRLDLVAEVAVARARRDRPGIRFTTDLEETVVHGVPATIERAIGNLLDNAAKWSPSDGEVHLMVKDREVTVTDHGPGIDDEDLPYVFDRFYRARSARGLPGSGLGLAIVRQVAEAHGGTVLAERGERGGTRMTLRLDGSAAPLPSEVDGAPALS
jgi:two-component system sensor histidine kinase MprB